MLDLLKLSHRLLILASFFLGFIFLLVVLMSCFRFLMSQITDRVLRFIPCVATVQGLTGSRCSVAARIFAEPGGCVTCLYSRVGEPRTHAAAACPPACLCVAHCVSPVPLHLWWHPAGSPHHLLYLRTQTELAGCQQILCSRPW